MTNLTAEKIFHLEDDNENILVMVTIIKLTQ